MTDSLTFSPERRRVVGCFALLGALSGAAGFLLAGVIEWLIERGGVWHGSFDVLILLPGAIYGLVVGFALYRLGLIGKSNYANYVAIGATSHFLSYVLAVSLGTEAYDTTTAVLMGGLSGSAVQVLLTLIVIRFSRRVPAIVGTLAAGVVPGLVFALVGWPNPAMWVTMYALWQACLAASVASAIPVRSCLAARSAGFWTIPRIVD